MSDLSAEQIRDLTPHLAEAFEELSESAAGGDVAARREMIAASRDYLLFIANQQMDAEVRPRFAPSDMVQNAMAQAVEKFAEFRGGNQRALLGWLRQILLNQIKDAIKHAHAGKRDVNREKTLDPSEGGVRLEARDADLTPASEAIAREEARQLREALVRLSPDYQQVLKLRNGERLSFADIASRMDRSETAVKKLWGRAIEALKREMQ
ncbi:MAG: sigma-70 family RNA polymerase sigma factor [Planctomycetota bacterium]